MRDHHAEVRQRGAEILAIAPHDLAEARRLVEELKLPFPVLADPQRRVFQAYDVPSRLWSLGQRPGTVLIDRDGTIRWAYLGSQQWETAPISEILAALDQIQSPSHETKQDS